MTSPNGGVPSGGITGSGGMASHARTTEGQWRDSIYDQVNSSFDDVNIFGALLRSLISTVLAFFSGFATVIEAIFGTVNDDYVAALPIINDHSQSIEELQAAVGQTLLQGQSIKFQSNNDYTPSEGITSIDVILVAAGGGGGGAEWDVFFFKYGGGGGSGGGEVHTSIPASLLPRNAENTAYLPIPIIVGEAGAGAPYGGAGGGGGNTSFGDYLTAGGGIGGTMGSLASAGSAGGVGMISGGRGGVSYKPGDSDTGRPAEQAVPGGNSSSAYSLNGGGGGGGAGAGATGATGTSYAGSNGGAGGISPGGIYVTGATGATGSNPSPVVATGAGGGAGGGAGRSGGAGGYPGGGGGGAGASPSSNTSMRGGPGGRGIVFVIERFG